MLFRSVRFQAYLGSRKGSAFTLQQLAGNDTDQASLLIAMLRAAGIPSRYVRGTVELTPEQAMAWTGLDEPRTAASLLTTAGLDGLAIVNGPDVVAVRCTRVWVEAWVPYSNYRGVPNDDTGKGWVPLDPAFKENAVTPGEDVLAAMGFDTDAYLADYIATVRAQSPLEKLQADIQAWLDVNRPGKTVADIERTLSIRELNLGLLPASLPYQLVSVSGRLSELEASKRYHVRFHLHDGGTTFLDYTISLPELITKRLTVDYVGATPSDQQTIDGFGGIYETPPNLVNVVPRLKLDGVAVATSVNFSRMGYTHDWDMHFLQPSGDQNQQPVISNEIIAGNGQAVAFDTFLDRGGALLGFGDFGGGPAVEGVLHPTAAEYLNRVDGGLRKAEGLMAVVTTQDVSEAIVESAVKVEYSFNGAPISFSWTGLIVDADRRIVGSFAANGQAGKSLEYMKLTGYEGSNQENRVFEDTYAQEAVSTIKILQKANDAGIGVCTITSSIGGECPGFNHPASIINAVHGALARGHHIIIPRTGMTIGLWSGTGYIDMDPVTGAAGYIIAGGISGNISVSGGATVQTWPIILACSPLAGTLKAEVTSPATDSPDPAAVFCPDDSPFSFTIKLKYDCRNRPGQEMTVARSTTLTKRQIAVLYGPGLYTISVSGAPTVAGQHPRKLALAGVEFVTPAGDPVGGAVDGGDGGSAPDGANEFTYSSANPGILTLKLKAKVIPTGIANVLKDRVLFTISTIGSSSEAWAGANPNGKPTASGDNLLAEYRCAGLPASNGKFGLKETRITCGAVELGKASFEVFFPRDASNHPGGQAGSPNWFHYWGEVVGMNNLVYAATPPRPGVVGHVKGMLNWNYNALADKANVYIHPAVVTKRRSYGVGIEVSGIDSFAGTAIHENKHVDQISRADALVATGDSFRYGWSFNQPTHNHWSVGPDGKWGVAGVDDDGNRVVDDAKAIPPFEPGRGDDVSLQHATYGDWPAAWALPSPNNAPHPLESEAVNATDTTMSEHQNAPKDWAAPGKNHQTLNDYTD